jgi:pimeloyl-ACP methyl ester carboxylesterase
LINPILLRLLGGALLALPLFAQAATKPCRVPDFPQEVQCGQVQRPLDPTKPDGKKIDVHYVVIPSQDRNKLTDAVFFLAGGPGQSAIDVSKIGEMVLGKLNSRRDLVFVDQRGTGKSAPLKCPELDANDEIIDKEMVIKRANVCMQNLQKLPYGDLRFFSTSIAVQDLEAVRLAQKYSAINVVGGSYGTRAGLEYLRQYPQAVRRLIIDGVVPPDLDLLASDAKSALDGIFADCKKASKCDTAYPDLAGSWKRLLTNTPRQITVTNSRLGTEVHTSVTREDIIGMVFKGLYSPTVTSVLPYAITQAEQGKFGPMASLSGSFNLPGQGGIDMGMHYSVWCSEAYARPRQSTNTDEFSVLMSDMYGRICANWPRAEIPKEFFTIPKSNVPVLLLSGGIDPVTPTRNGDLVAKALGEKARHISIENMGHGLMTHGCVRYVMTRFIGAKDDAEAVKVDASCVRQIPRPTVWLPPSGASKNASNSASKNDAKSAVKAGE